MVSGRNLGWRRESGVFRNATPPLRAPVDVMGVPLTCGIRDFSTLIEQLAEGRGSELDGLPSSPAQSASLLNLAQPSLQLPSRPCSRFPCWSAGCYSLMLIHARPSAEDPRKHNPCCYLLSLGHLGIAQCPTNKEQRCKGFPSRPSVYSCLCLAVLPRRHPLS